MCLIFFKSNAMSLRCFVDNSGVLSTKEQLVDESLEEAFLGGPQVLANFVSPSSARRLSALKKESSYGHVDICL